MRNQKIKNCIECDSFFEGRGRFCRPCLYTFRKRRCIERRLCIRCSRKRGKRQENKLFCFSCSCKQKQRYHKTKDTRADRSLRIRCGITLADKKRMYIKQKKACGLCGLLLPKNYKQAHTDHNHKTGKVRSLLHQRCNILVGHIENPLFGAALSYLRRHK